jgi:hypothetical protein
VVGCCERCRETTGSIIRVKHFTLPGELMVKMFIPEQATKAQKGSRAIAPFLL